MKTRKNRLLALLMVCLLILSTAGCGGNSKSSGEAKSDYAAEGAYATADYGYYDDYDAVAEESAMEAPSMANSARTGGTDAAQQGIDKGNVKIIYTANVDIEALDLDAAIGAMKKLVEEDGAYIQTSYQGTSGRSRYASFTVRVPSAKYRAFVDAWSDSENIKLLSAREDSQDVGAQYFDLETHLATLRTKMSRLQALMEQATEMTDIIELESAISDTEYEIERYTSDLNRYDSLINFSTVNLSITEVVKLEEPEEISFFQRVGQNFRWGLEDFVEFLEELVVWIAYNFLTLIVMALIIVAIVKVHKRRKAKRQANPKPPRFRFNQKKDKTSKAPAAPVKAPEADDEPVDEPDDE